MLRRSAATITQECPSESPLKWTWALLISVLEDGLPVVHFQEFGSSIHFNPPTKLKSLALLYGSVKWNVVEELSGRPAASNTAPPLPALVESIQSPALAAGMLANRSPSMLNPPAGCETGATPGGGGEAVTAIAPRTRHRDKGKRRRVARRTYMDALNCFISVAGPAFVLWISLPMHRRAHSQGDGGYSGCGASRLTQP